MASKLTAVLLITVSCLCMASGISSSTPAKSPSRKLPKIFGVGLSKTGTTSLARALEELGLVTIHNDKGFVPFLYSSYDFTDHYKGVDAVVDLPTAVYYKEMMKEYSDSLFILTVRDKEGWFKSFDTYYQNLAKMHGGSIPYRNKVLIDYVYGSPEPDKELWSKKYEEHNARVLRELPRDRLLVMNIVDKNDGWDMLCPFLRLVEGPCAPGHANEFPKANSGTQAQLQALQSADWAMCHPPEPKPTVARPRDAYVLTVSPSDHREYFIATLVLAKSLLDTKTRADVVVLTLPGMSPLDTMILGALNVIVKEVHPLGFAYLEAADRHDGEGSSTGSVVDPSHPEITSSAGEDRIVGMYRSHLRAVQLVEYDRVISLDSDSVVMKNMDHLFALADESRFNVRAGLVSPVNSDFFVVKPNCEDFIDIKDTIRSNTWTADKGWMRYGKFPDWRQGHQGEMTNWNFLGSSADQGLLFYHYILLHNGTTMPHDKYSDLFVHFLGFNKPYMVGQEGILNAPHKYREAMKLWFTLLEDLEFFVGEPLLEDADLRQLVEETSDEQPQGVLGIDVSTALTVEQLRCLKTSGVDFIIARAWKSTNTSDVNSGTTLVNAHTVGGFSSVDVYMFPCQRCGCAECQIRAMLEDLKPYNTQFGRCWLDIEGVEYWSELQSENRQFFHDLVVAAESHGLNLGIYTSASQWLPIMGGWSGGSSYPLWYAHYDNQQSFRDFKPFGGWNHPTWKQYIDDEMQCYADVDLNWRQLDSSPTDNVHVDD